MGDALFRKKFDTPEEINGRYTLIKRVGKGSYGVVYEALDTETNDKVSALGDPWGRGVGGGSGLGRAAAAAPSPPLEAGRRAQTTSASSYFGRRWVVVSAPRAAAAMLAGLGTGAVPRAGGGGRGAGWTGPKPGGSGPG